MKNNKGQVLITFVLIIPVLVLALAYIFDMSLLNYEKNKLNNIGDYVIEYLKQDEEKTDEDIKKIIKLNDNSINISIENNKIILKKNVKGVFTNIIGKDNYVVEVSIDK